LEVVAPQGVEVQILSRARIAKTPDVRPVFLLLCWRGCEPLRVQELVAREKWKILLHFPRANQFGRILIRPILSRAKIYNGNKARDMNYSLKRLTPSDMNLLKNLLAVFGEAFNERETYQDAVPSDAYLESLLAKPHFIVLIALDGDQVVGGLAAYELEKFEQDRREIYIYDLAVKESHRRKGIATGLINRLKEVAKQRDAYVIFVQADREDVAAI